jgi:tRNA(Ile)-lysidine synthase
MAIQPLAEQDFDSLMAELGPFESRPHLACAVSGGADSLALALLAWSWTERQGGRLTALTVDHGLRPEAADEARQVGDWLGVRGIAHRVLAWRGAKPTSGLQAAARAERYRLLADWCRETQVLHLLLGHTLDDQAETLLLRLGSGSGPNGLAAMTAVRETADVRLLRPLLGVPRAALRATLEAEGQPWIDDPSNVDDRYARVRVRRAIAAGGLLAADLARAAARFGRVRVALESAASQLLARAVGIHPAGFARFDAQELASVPEEVGLRALSRLIASIGGSVHGPRLDRLERLYRNLVAGDGRSWTLGGCRIVRWDRLGVALICREDRGVDTPVAVRPGQRLVWDGRFALRLAGAPGQASADAWLAGLGRDGWNEVVGRRPDLRQGPVPGPARPSLPALYDAQGVLAVPHLDYQRADRSAVPGPTVEIAEIRFSPPGTLGSVGFFLPNRRHVLSL